jgi:hypothetical protein
MYRAAIERSRTVCIWRRHLATHASPIRCDCELQIGRFRKGQRIGGCSTPACCLCHFAKLMGIPTVQEQRFVATYREGLAEVARPNHSLNRTARRRRLHAVRSRPVSLVR